MQVLVKVLASAYLASAGETAIIAFFLGVSTDLTFPDHLIQALPPVLILIVIVTVLQAGLYQRWLVRTRDFYELLGRSSPPEEELGPAALLAQEELQDFPFRASLLSFILWSFCGLFLAVTLSIPWHATFFLWEVVLIAAMSGLGGVINFVFQFYFCKQAIRRELGQLMRWETGFHLRQKVARSRRLQVKLQFTFISLLAVGLIWTILFAYFQGSRILRDSNLELERKMKRNWVDHVQQGMQRTWANSLLSEAFLHTGIKFFVVDHAGIPLYGEPPPEYAAAVSEALVRELRRAADRPEQLVTYRLSSGSEMIFTAVPDLLGAGEPVFLTQIFRWSDVRPQEHKMLVLLLIIGVGIIFLSFWVVRLHARDILDPINEIVANIEKVAQGYLNVDFNILSEDEIGLLAGRMKAMMLNLRDLVERIQTAYHNVDTAISDILKSSEEVAKGAEVQANSLEETSLSTEEMNTVIREVSDNVEILQSSAEDGTRRIQEMAQLVEEVEENFEELSQAVESTSSSIWEMTASIRQVAGNVEALLSRSEETSSAMLEMEASIKQVEETIRENSGISDLVKENARLGVDAVQSTIGGIGAIEESVSEAMEVIHALGESTEKIGKILNVIRDVANQTNLLALNAAIIASQAGEHGKGFAVVSDEIKNLAERVANSTKEIDAIIKRVQNETKRVVEVMKVGYQNVEQGVNLSYQAGSALEKIQKSVEQSYAMMGRISKVTAEQVQNTRKATQAIEIITDLIQQIAGSTAEQTKGSDQIIHATGQIKEIAPNVQAKAKRQTEASRQVHHAMDNISQMVKFIHNSQKAQALASERIVEAINRIKNITLANVGSVTSLDRNIAILNQQSEILKAVVALFKLDEKGEDQPQTMRL
ncbi:MAG: hypothetical protein A2V67_00795 [Deltaproteobacteria bacterium RBG_13_61_14]|nr:MAG: hypothetical protein A2V67_00795 [Deltaproteobacteria bacterium RBG_13_61_14]